jgi:hypothetical protein
MDKTILSSSHKASIAQSLKGKKQSPETIQKRKETWKKKHQAKEAMRTKRVIPQTGEQK